MIIELMVAGVTLLHPPFSNEPIGIELIKKEEAALEEDGRSNVDIHRVRGVATGYTSYCEGCSGITASGYDLRKEGVINGKGYRVIASDLPLGTLVDVRFNDGVTIHCIVLDRGGAIVGNRIDIAFETTREALKFGRQDVEYTITGKVDVK